MKRRLAIVFTFICAGCTVEPGTSEFEAQTFPDAGPSETGGPAEGDVGLGEGEGAGTMSGTWMQLHEASTCVVVAEQITRAVYLLDITQTDRTLSESRRLCAFELSPVLGLEVQIPLEVVDAVQVLDVDNGYVSSVAPNGTYSSATEVGLWGVDLENPLTDVVPDEPDDPAVIDADDDGNPGVTFGVVGSDCERYVAQRSIVRYTGTFTQPNQIDGTSITVTDTNVLGSSEALCGVSPRITANDRLSRFRMVRVDGAGGSLDLDVDGDGEISCDEVAPFGAELFERREASPENCD